MRLSFHCFECVQKIGTFEVKDGDLISTGINKKFLNHVEHEIYYKVDEK